MEDVAGFLRNHRAFFATGKTLDVGFRRESLRSLKNALLRYEDKIYEAFWEDLHKARLEVFGTEIGMVLKEINLHQRKVRKWAKPGKVLTDWINFYSTSRVLHQPYGVVLIMAPWNYPLLLALLPLVGAISGGQLRGFETGPLLETHVSGDLGPDFRDV